MFVVLTGCKHAANQNVTVLKTKLETLQHEHQESLESLTNKCLAFEEELSKKCHNTRTGYLVSMSQHDKGASEMRSPSTQEL